MKLVSHVGAQGDVLFIRLDDVIPGEAKPMPVKGGAHVVAHSETGHHHTVQADGVVLYEGPSDPFTCYLRVDTSHADVVHLRPFDTHETLRLGQGTWQVRRQREYTPQGFRRVED